MMRVFFEPLVMLGRAQQLIIFFCLLLRVNIARTLACLISPVISAYLALPAP
eukprot:m.289794 g.289794  ORF g.289794 m.289794 type:complete len:52 (-) comp192881_c0_seq1:2-157(-)